MYVSIRDTLLRNGDFSSPVEGMRNLGVDAVEVALRGGFEMCAMDSFEEIPVGSDQEAEEYHARLESLGIRACALLTARDFSQDEHEENVGWVVRAVELADRMGIGVVRIDSAMARERELDFQARVELFADGLASVLKRTEGSKVALGIENHGYQGNNLTFLLNVFKRVASSRLGVTMDTGNFYWRGYPLSEVYGILHILAPHTKHTHLKNIAYPADKREEMREAGWEYGKYVAPLDQGDIDHSLVLSMLEAHGYKGDLCIEDESLARFREGEERIAVLRRDVDYVKGLIASLG